MTGLVAFLLTCLNEDERLARLARDTEPELWADVEMGGIPDLDVTMATVAMMNRWSPRLVLAECEAKRRIIELCATWIDQGNRVDADLVFKTQAITAKTILRELVRPYADRPGYREEWRP